MCPRARVLVAAVLALCCGVMMAPRLVSPRFGLLDDGTTLLIADAYQHTPLGVLNIEAARGRFRPVYWLYYIEQYPLWGKAPAGYFAVQLVALIATTLLLSQLVTNMTGGSVASLAGGLGFLVSGPVWESYYTLSKPEPPLVLFVVAASLSLFAAMKGRRIYLVGTAVGTTLAYLTKETAVVLLPVSLAFALIAWSRASLRKTLFANCLINLVCTLVFVVGRYTTGTDAIFTGTDSSNYSLSGTQVFASLEDAAAWMIRDFAFGVPLVVGAILVARRRSGLSDTELLIGYGGLVAFAWIAIMLPWHSSFEYYLLPVAVGIGLMIGGSAHLLGQSLRHRRPLATAAGVASVILACVPLANGITTARLQLAVDEVNAELLQALAHAPQAGEVAVDLPNDNEYVFELGQQLRELYDRGDISVVGTGAGTTSALAAGTIVIVQRVQNRPVITPRMSTGTTGLFARSDLDWSDAGSATRQFRLAILNAQEPFCRALRLLDLARGDICADPVLVLDNREFSYGWDLYRVLE